MKGLLKSWNGLMYNTKGKSTSFRYDSHPCRQNLPTWDRVKGEKRPVVGFAVPSVLYIPYMSFVDVVFLPQSESVFLLSSVMFLTFHLHVFVIGLPTRIVFFLPWSLLLLLTRWVCRFRSGCFRLPPAWTQFPSVGFWVVLYWKSFFMGMPLLCQCCSISFTLQHLLVDCATCQLAMSFLLFLDCLLVAFSYHLLLNITGPINLHSLCNSTVLKFLSFSRQFPFILFSQLIFQYHILIP